jgi:hypothetical protein
MSVFIICPIVSLQQFFCTQRLELLNFEVAWIFDSRDDSETKRINNRYVKNLNFEIDL